jgi:hypothetical protein
LGILLAGKRSIYQALVHYDSSYSLFTGYFGSFIRKSLIAFSFQPYLEKFAQQLRFSQPLEHILPIPIIYEYLSTLDATDHDVMQDTGCVKAGLSWHGIYFDLHLPLST